MTNPLISKALEIASIAHAKQKRKGTNIPYIIHPVGVMLVASEVTDDPAILAACLLHDVLEDCDPSIYSEADMLRDFGADVTNAVKAVSKDETISGWRERNEAYLDHIRSTPHTAAHTVCAADKIHNLTSMLEDYEVVGNKLWDRFNASKEAQLWWYESVLEALASRDAPIGLTDQLSDLVAKLKLVLTS